MTLEEFQAGHVFNVNKPVTWSSFSVVNKIKYILKHQFSIKKIKVGHAGTLDPFATGVLVVCIGKKTKEISKFVDSKKTYKAQFKFGEISDSYDITGEITKIAYDKLPSNSEIEDIISKHFLGDIQQIPPMFSAKKIDGQRLYKLARKGIEIERKPNSVHIYSYEILSYENDVLDVEIVCSKGTYIRSLAHDLGQVLKCGAYCHSLERLKVGDFDINDSLTIEELEEFICNSPSSAYESKDTAQDIS